MRLRRAIHRQFSLLIVDHILKVSAGIHVPHLFQFFSTYTTSPCTPPFHLVYQRSFSITSALLSPWLNDRPPIQFLLPTMDRLMEFRASIHNPVPAWARRTLMKGCSPPSSPASTPFYDVTCPVNTQGLLIPILFPITLRIGRKLTPQANLIISILFTVNYFIDYWISDVGYEKVVRASWSFETNRLAKYCIGMSMYALFCQMLVHLCCGIPPKKWRRDFRRDIRSPRPPARWLWGDRMARVLLHVVFREAPVPVSSRRISLH